MNKLILIAGTVGWGHLAAGSVLFSTDFNSGIPAEFSGRATPLSVGALETGTGGLFSGLLLFNDSVDPIVPTILTLTDLPSHNRITISFLFAAIDTWDPSDWCGPDYFNVTVDGACVLHKTTVELSGFLCAFPNAIGNSDSWDAVYDMGWEAGLRDVVHTSSTLTIAFFPSGVCWQGGDDESWGIENLVITASLPEAASSLALLGGMMTLMGVLHRAYRK